MTERLSLTTGGEAVVAGSTPKFSNTTGSPLTDSGVSLTAAGAGDLFLSDDGSYKSTGNVSAGFSNVQSAGATADTFAFNPSGSSLLFTLGWNTTEQQYTFVVENASILLLKIGAQVTVGSSRNNFLESQAIPYFSNISVSAPVVSTVYYMNNSAPTAAGNLKYNGVDLFSGTYNITIRNGAAGPDYLIYFNTNLIVGASSQVETIGVWKQFTF